MTWHFNNRKNQYLFRDTLVRLLASNNHEYKELTTNAKVHRFIISDCRQKMLYQFPAEGS